MKNSKEKFISRFPVSEIFQNANYIVPIYQRNYAWGKDNIEKLIEDINDSKNDYFFGNLIVFPKSLDTFEVIDGQQRLTTLYLLLHYLNGQIAKGALSFESRMKYDETLANLDKIGENDILVEELCSGYKIIEQYFKNNKEKVDFKRKLDSTYLLRVKVPENIDLNHYFEIMNTRGEQLELHEIAKAKILEKLKTSEEKQLGALIWDNVRDVDRYLQLTFDSEVRHDVFGDDYNTLKCEDFDSLLCKTIRKQAFGNRNTLKEIMQKPKRDTDIPSNTEEDSTKCFQSIISFPNFLLYVNETLQEQKTNLDDKNLLSLLERNWNNENTAKEFLYKLFKCKFLFDKYIIKRDYRKKKEGEWSLLQIALQSESKHKYYYKESYKKNEKDNLKLRMLQSCLRITYTSPKTMHWIPLLLRSLLDDENQDIVSILENYASRKVEESKYKSVNFAFDYERIVFSYLDYILFRDGYKDIIPKMDERFEFQFRNSIEHFYPQNPKDAETWQKNKDVALNSFGNLALITVSGNSRFSNDLPKAKIIKETIINQSNKLKIMAKLTDSRGWDELIVYEHKNEMFDLLDKELNRFGSRISN